MTASTTIGEIVAALSAEEVSCWRNLVPDLDAFFDVPLGELYDSGLDFRLDCLKPENAPIVVVAWTSIQAGGVSAETHECMLSIATLNPATFGSAETEDIIITFATIYGMPLCLTEEERVAKAENTGTDVPPSGWRCLEEKLGGLDNLRSMLASEEPDIAELTRMLSATQECGDSFSWE
ncbi:MAG: hypothetical protein OXL97_00695 [Chloroflexota bacterium]|nr:hypothetical protein [Chloroflexota bacterium]MDE2883661.1 hypothetical protein [Chloroflexota bacterium]